MQSSHAHRSNVPLRKLLPSSLHPDHVTSRALTFDATNPDMRQFVNATRTKLASDNVVPDSSHSSSTTSTNLTRSSSAPVKAPPPSGEPMTSTSPAPPTTTSARDAATPSQLSPSSSGDSGAI